MACDKKHEEFGWIANQINATFLSFNKALLGFNLCITTFNNYYLAT